MVEKFIANIKGIKKICEVIQIDYLKVSEQKTLEELLPLLYAYKKSIKILEASYEITISKVITQMIVLKHELTNRKDSASISNLVKVLLEEFEDRFQFIFNDKHEKFNELYSLASFLDPQTHKYMRIPAISSIYEFATNFVKNVAKNPAQPADPDSKNMILDEMLAVSNNNTDQFYR